MEAGRNLVASSPPFFQRTHVKNCASPSSVSMLHDQAVPGFSCASSTLAHHFPTSVLLQEQRDENRVFFQMMKEDGISQVALERRQMNGRISEDEDDNNVAPDQHVKDYQRQLLNLPGLWYSLPCFRTGETLSLPLDVHPVSSKIKKAMDVEPHTVIALAKKALSASKQAAMLSEDSRLYEADFDESINSSLSTSLADFLPEEKVVRSTRHLERRSKKRTVSMPKIMVQDNCSPWKVDLRRKMSEAFDPNDALRMFLWGPETKQLLTLQEESELIIQIQDLMRLEQVKSRLHSQFDREPTLVEWAAAMGLTSRDLKSRFHSGNSSREKLIFANLRLVVHIAKQYQGRGLNLHDLLQEGSMGLLKSVEKFKPQAGCRFATYAYWWIRQAIRKAIFQHSRTIRLPDNVYGLLYKVTEAKRSFIQEGNHKPTKEEIAARAGIALDKLESLLFSARMPLSMQRPVWMDQDTTFQEITADTAVEIPDVGVAKQLMRQHVRNLLGTLTPRERRIIWLRYGIVDGKPKSLSEIGDAFGLSKERVRQLESRAFYKLKQSLSSQGLYAYANLVI